jgi:ankyrin repeat protein
MEPFSVASATTHSSMFHCFLASSTSQNHTNASFNPAWPTLIIDSSTAASEASHYRELSENPSSLSFLPSEMNACDFIGWNDPGPSTSNSLLNGLSRSTASSSSNFLTPDFATTIVPIISRMFSRVESSLPIILLGDSSGFESAINNASHPSTRQLIHQLSHDHQFIYMIFHRLVNDGNAARALDNPQAKLDHFFKMGVTYCFSLREEDLIGIINATPSPYAVSLIQNMFSAALILGDAHVLGIIMRLNQESFVNRPVLLGDSHYYPLEYTSIRGYVEATQLLLRHGADPNRQKDYSYSLKIGRGLEFLEKTSRTRVQILQMLIDHGLELDPFHFKHGIRRSDTDELSVILTYCLRKSFETFFYQRALPNILLHPDWNDSFSKTMKAALDQAYLESAGRQDLWNKVLSESLSSAVLRSHASAVDILLDMGAEPDVDCLISAAQGNDLKTFEDFLNRGLDPNVRVLAPRRGSSKFDHDKDYSATALSEAIKNRFRGALQVLQARGFVLSSADQPAGFVSALTAACEVGDNALVDQLLSLPNSSRRHASSYKAIEAATAANQEHMVKKLLSTGIKPSLRCLLTAIQAKQLATVELLASCMDIPEMLEETHGYYEHQDEENIMEYDNGIITEALLWGNQEAIEHVLGIGHPVSGRVNFQIIGIHSGGWDPLPDLDPPGNQYNWTYTPLSLAILEENTAAVQALMACDAQVGFHSSRLTSHQSTARNLGNSYRDSGWTITPLAAAAIRKNVSLVEEFLSLGVDPFDACALYVCAVIDAEDIIVLLLDAFRRRYPNGIQCFGSDALYQTIRHGNIRLLDLLVKDSDITGPVSEDQESRSGDLPYIFRKMAVTSPLGEAIRLHAESNGESRVLDLLLPLVKDHSAVVHEDSKRGKMTSLLYAIVLGSLETVQTLHQAGANIFLSAPWNVRRTPLQAAVQAESKDIVNYLLAQGVSPNEPPATRAGATALQLAAIAGNIDIATTLLDAGADINAPPAFFDGRTAFEGATEHGRVDMMIFLVTRGTDLLANENEQFRRAVKFAEENLQHAAKALAEDLHQQVLASQGTNFFGIGANEWTGTAVDGFGSFVF